QRLARDRSQGKRPSQRSPHLPEPRAQWSEKVLHGAPLPAAPFSGYKGGAAFLQTGSLESRVLAEAESFECRFIEPYRRPASRCHGGIPCSSRRSGCPTASRSSFARTTGFRSSR